MRKVITPLPYPTIYNSIDRQVTDLVRNRPAAWQKPWDATIPPTGAGMNTGRIHACESLILKMEDIPHILHGAKTPGYCQTHDRIYMPAIETFRIPEEYYATLFHEIVHSTGHPDRLNRPQLTSDAALGTYDYSYEELVAEIGAAYLCAMSRIHTRTIDNQAAYMAMHLKILREFPTGARQPREESKTAIEWLLNT